MQPRVVGHWTRHLEHVYDALSRRLPNGRIDDVPDYVLNAFVGRDDGLHWIIDQNEVWRAWRWFFEWFNMSVVEFALITEDLFENNSVNNEIFMEVLARAKSWVRGRRGTWRNSYFNQLRA